MFNYLIINKIQIKNLLKIFISYQINTDYLQERASHYNFASY